MDDIRPDIHVEAARLPELSPHDSARRDLVLGATAIAGLVAEANIPADAIFERWQWWLGAAGVDPIEAAAVIEAHAHADPAHAADTAIALAGLRQQLADVLRQHPPAWARDVTPTPKPSVAEPKQPNSKAGEATKESLTNRDIVRRAIYYDTTNEQRTWVTSYTESMYGVGSDPDAAAVAVFNEERIIELCKLLYSSGFAIDTAELTGQDVMTMVAHYTQEQFRRIEHKVGRIMNSKVEKQYAAGQIDQLLSHLLASTETDLDAIAKRHHMSNDMLVYTMNKFARDTGKRCARVVANMKEQGIDVISKPLIQPPESALGIHTDDRTDTHSPKGQLAGQKTVIDANVAVESFGVPILENGLGTVLSHDSETAAERVATNNLMAAEQQLIRATFGQLFNESGVTPQLINFLNKFGLLMNDGSTLKIHQIEDLVVAFLDKYIDAEYPNPRDVSDRRKTCYVFIGSLFLANGAQTRQRLNLRYTSYALGRRRKRIVDRTADPEMWSPAVYAKIFANATPVSPQSQADHPDSWEAMADPQQEQTLVDLNTLEAEWLQSAKAELRGLQKRLASQRGRLTEAVEVEQLQIQALSSSATERVEALKQVHTVEAPLATETTEDTVLSESDAVPEITLSPRTGLAISREVMSAIGAYPNVVDKPIAADVTSAMTAFCATKAFQQLSGDAQAILVGYFTRVPAAKEVMTYLRAEQMTWDEQLGSVKSTSQKVAVTQRAMEQYENAFYDGLEAFVAYLRSLG